MLRYAAMITAVLAVASHFRAVRCRGHPAAAFRISLTVDPEPFEFVCSGPDEPYLVRTRNELGLDDIVADPDDKLHVVQLVSAWVHVLWDHHGTDQPTYSDPISMVREAEEGGRFRCVEYSIVIHGALNSLGIPTRMLHLKTHDAQTRKNGGGHVKEVYLEEAAGG